MNEATRELIQQLGGNEEGLSTITYEMIEECDPSGWDLQVVNSVNTAAKNNHTIETISLDLGVLTGVSLLPFLTFLSESRSIEFLELKANLDDLAADLVFAAIAMNPNSPLKSLTLDSVSGNPQRFYECMESAAASNVSEVTVLCRSALFYRFGIIRSLDYLEVTLPENRWNEEDHIPETNMMIQSLQNHPNLHTIEWSSPLSSALMTDLLSLCISCNKLEVVKLTNTGPLFDATHVLQSSHLNLNNERRMILDNLRFSGDTFYPVNESLTRLVLHNCSFADASASTLGQFLQLKDLHMYDCTGVARYLVQVCEKLPNLEFLIVYVGDNGDQIEASEYVQRLPRLMAIAPRYVSFGFCTVNNDQVLACVSQGLDHRLEPLLKLGLTFKNWEIGFLKRLTDQVLSKARALEILELWLEGGCEFTFDESRHFMKSVVSLSNLEYLNLDTKIEFNRDEAEMLAKKCEDSFILQDILVQLGDGSFEWEEANYERIRFFTDLNSRFRKYAVNQNFNASLWPSILAKLNPTELFHVVKALHATDIIFRK